MQTFSSELEKAIKSMDIRSGDSDWIWAKNLSGKKGEIGLLLEDT